MSFLFVLRAGPLPVAVEEDRFLRRFLPTLWLARAGRRTAATALQPPNDKPERYTHSDTRGDAPGCKSCGRTKSKAHCNP